MNRSQLEAIELGKPVTFENLTIDRIIVGIHLGWVLYDDGKEVLATRYMEKVLRYLRSTQVDELDERDGEIIAFD